jgi:hypothetical protein
MLMRSLALVVVMTHGNAATPVPRAAEPSAEPAAADLNALAAADFTFSPAVADAACMNVSFDVEALGASFGQIPQSAEPSSQPAGQKHEFFKQGSWRWQPTMSLASDFNDVSLGMGGVAFSYFIEDNLTIDFELNALYINQQSRASDTGAVNANLLLRWHCWMDQAERPRWSVYFDAGGGLLYAGSDVPLHGSHFNFTPQAGAGVSLLLNQASDTRLLAGVRWFHISNANVFDANDGVDSLMVYAGINFAF